VLDATGTTIAVNAAFERFARSHPRSEVRLGTNYLAACDERAAAGDYERAAIADGLRKMLAGELEDFTSHYVLEPGEQTRRWFGVRATRFRGEGPGRIVVQHYDSTALVQMQDDARLRTRLIDEIDAAVVAGDLDGNVELWSRGAEKVFGWTAAEVLGRQAAEVIVAAEDLPAAQRAQTLLKQTGTRIAERELQRKDGSRFAGYASSAVYRDDDGAPRGLISVIVDDTDRVRAAQELREARDHLRAVTDSMGEALCTLDDAGHVSYMNAAAERLLGWSIDELRGRSLHDAVHIRRADGSPAPIEQCPLHGGHKASESVRVEDDVFVRRDGSELPVSWVLAPFESPAGNNSVIVFADNTRAKAAQQRLEFEIEHLSQVRDLHEALQEHRFEHYAQPIVDLATGAVVSHELLLRMRERDGTLRLPASFLAVAERCGLIRELDRWGIAEAARLAGEGHHVELNLSATSLGDPGLFDVFEAAIAEHGAKPACIGVELTETAIMQDEKAAGVFIERVGALGCEFALDDFGTGFGGFAYLKHLPVDFLKIDIEFVRDVRTNMASRHVVQAVVGLAAAFGLRTVAEGVEDPETLATVRDMGVDLAQGYAIGRPGPLHDTLYSAA
jgi:PAS domain S-box-containing protein